MHLFMRFNGCIYFTDHFCANVTDKEPIEIMNNNWYGSVSRWWTIWRINSKFNSWTPIHQAEEKNFPGINSHAGQFSLVLLFIILAVIFILTTKSLFLSLFQLCYSETHGQAHSIRSRLNLFPCESSASKVTWKRDGNERILSSFWIIILANSQKLDLLLVGSSLLLFLLHL